MADCSKLSVQHTKTNVLQTSDACAGVRNVDCWWSVDEDAKWCRLMRRCSCEDTKDRMAIVLYELDASADITWTRFAVRQAASDGLWESGSRDHVDQDAQQDGLRHSELAAMLQWSIYEGRLISHYNTVWAIMSLCRIVNTKFCYRRRTARRLMSVEISSAAARLQEEVLQPVNN